MPRLTIARPPSGRPSRFGKCLPVLSRLKTPSRLMETIRHHRCRPIQRSGARAARNGRRNLLVRPPASASVRCAPRRGLQPCAAHRVPCATRPLCPRHPLAAPRPAACTSCLMARRWRWCPCQRLRYVDAAAARHGAPLSCHITLLVNPSLRRLLPPSRAAAGQQYQQAAPAVRPRQLPRSLVLGAALDALLQVRAPLTPGQGGRGPWGQ